ncbi:MAG: hypothetical protein GYA59_07015 [Chloroflexi bacterium]|nr:hypothetical protein [Chloroflexota bacterium]
MNADQHSEGQDTGPKSSTESWEDVGRQFQALGESLAAAFRSAWQSEEGRQAAQKMRQGVEGMVDELGQVFKEGMESPEGQRIRSEVEEAARNLRESGAQAAQEAQPHLIDALHRVNEELQKLIEHLEQQKPGAGGSNPPPPAAS